MQTTTALRVALGLFMALCVVELALLSSMVAWLLNTVGTFKINFHGSSFDLKGEPLNILVNQGHASNGVGGTGFIIVGIGGFLALWLRNKHNPSSSSRSGVIAYYSWLVVAFLAFIYTLATLAYVFAVTNAHNGQTIDVAVAAGLDGAKYPLQDWTPQNWFSALLKLDLALDKQRQEIAYQLRLMKGWQYNLIPIFLFHLTVTALMVLDALKWRKNQRGRSPASAYAPKGESNNSF